LQPETNNRQNMKISIAKTTLFALVTAALVAVPAISRAQDSTNMPADNAPAAAPKKHGTPPIHGKVAAVDTAAMTITIGESTINITSETKISKDGKPATLSDIVVGDAVSASYKKDEAGKLNATTIRDGKKKKEAPATPPAPAPGTP
jgi:hypothetical protein